MHLRHVEFVERMEPDDIPKWELNASTGSVTCKRRHGTTAAGFSNHVKEGSRFVYLYPVLELFCLPLSLGRSSSPLSRNVLFSFSYFNATQSSCHHFFFLKKKHFPNHIPLHYSAYLIPVSIVKTINSTPSSSKNLCPLTAHPDDC